MKDVGRAASFQPVRLSAGEKQIKNDAQCINVAGRGNGLTLHLLGTGEIRRQYPFTSSCQSHWYFGSVVIAIGLNQLGNPEIDELGNAIGGGDQNVAWFQVAVDDGVLVSEVNRYTPGRRA